MSKPIKLSELVNQIGEAIENCFDGETFWITAEITDVRKQEGTRRCYLKLIEKQNNNITAEIRGVFWSNSYNQIETFEKATGQFFANGIELICNVKVRFHPRYGLNVDVLEIDSSYTIGKTELEKQKTLERLLKENPDTIKLTEGEYQTFNNCLELPVVIQKIALITAPNSDGQRDFNQELSINKHNYSFAVLEYLTQIQGDNASLFVLKQLQLIESRKENFDVVVIVRGGGSQTDFKPFDDYELSKYVATFPIPVLTGIGHDRNISIVDLMARQYKTPTKVATCLVENNFEFENKIIELQGRFFETVKGLIEKTKVDIDAVKRVVEISSPASILRKGFAIITCNNKIVTDPGMIEVNTELKTILKDKIIHSTVTKKTKNEN